MSAARAAGSHGTSATPGWATATSARPQPAGIAAKTATARHTDFSILGSPNLTGVPPGRLPPLEQPEPAGRYGARASARTLATVRDGRRVVPRRAWRAALAAP